MTGQLVNAGTGQPIDPTPVVEQFSSQCQDVLSARPGAEMDRDEFCIRQRPHAVGDEALSGEVRGGHRHEATVRGRDRGRRLIHRSGFGGEVECRSLSVGPPRMRVVTTDEQSTRGTDDTTESRRGWRDDPIINVGQDRLDREPFARRTARLIDDNYSANSSVVYGIEGPWGCGKSSVIAMTTTCLNDIGRKWKIVHFTPWATSGTEGLLAEFFAALSAVAPEGDGSSGLRRSILRYADIARPIAAVIPVVGDALREGVTVAENRARKPWSEAFADVADNLRRLNVPILVVVDDIDRLQTGELLDLLRVVRLLGRFPGVDFLLAYDEQTLIETLQDPARGHVSKVRGRAFMEKIVQFPLSVPPLLTGKIVKLLDAGLTEIMTPERAASFESHRFSDMILTTMPSQLTTPRAIERFLAQVREQFLAHDRDEINDVDLILATFLRVQFPDLFGRLQQWKFELTTGRDPHKSFGRRDDEAPKWEDLLAVVEDRDARRGARAVLETLFPVVASGSATRDRPRRFAHPEYFDRYLAQTIPEGDIPDSTVTRALVQASTGDDSELRALLLGDDEAVILALSKIRSRCPRSSSRTSLDGSVQVLATTDLLSAGMKLLSDAEERGGAAFSPVGQLTYWMADVLRLILDADPQADVDPALAACSEPTRRAHVLSTASNDLDGVEGSTPDAVRDALRREVRRLVPVLLADLRRRDDADEELGRSFLYALVTESDSLEDFQSEIRAGVGRGDFTLNDVAARIVSFSYLVGGPSQPWSATFSGPLFTKLTEVEASSTDFGESDKRWPDKSWARRRKFGSQHFQTVTEEAQQQE